VAYTKQSWTDNQTPVDKIHMDHIEDGLVTVDTGGAAAKGTANGYASLDAAGKVPIAQLPTYAGTYASRPAGNAVPVGAIYYATDSMGTFRSDGTNWTLVQQGAPVITAGQMDSAPWSTPYDGMRVRLLVDAANGVEWELAYRSAASDSNKWEFVGGPPRVVHEAGNQAVYNGWGKFTPQITVPRTGWYVASCENPNINANGATLLQAGPGLWSGTMSGGGGWASYVNTSGVGNTSLPRCTILMAATAGDQFCLWIHGGPAGATTNWRTIEVVPVRVS
jgi:hypothetical protein